jgi:hypothetical protein
MDKARRINIVAMAVILSVSAVNTYNYVYFVERPKIDERLEVHRSILDGTAPSPYNYRVLVPAATELLARIISSTGAPFRYAWISAYVIYDFICISLFLLTLYVFLVQWHPARSSLLGTIFCAAVLPVALRDHYYQPWSLLEAYLFCLAMLAAFRRRFTVMVVVTALASLNRVTGIFIPAIYLLGTLDPHRDGGYRSRSTYGVIARFAVLAVLSISIIAALRLVKGETGHISSLPSILRLNVSAEYLLRMMINVPLFAGAWWILAALGARLADPFTRRMLIFVPLYMAPVLLFGIWKEVRLLMPFYPILISLGLYYLERRLPAGDGPGLPPGRLQRKEEP